MSDVSTAHLSTGKVTVSPAEFTFVKYEATVIAEIVAELAAMFEISNPIKVIVDETTPLAKLSEELDGTSSVRTSSSSVRVSPARPTSQRRTDEAKPVTPCPHSQARMASLPTTRTSSTTTADADVPSGVPMQAMPESHRTPRGRR